MAMQCSVQSNQDSETPASGSVADSFEPRTVIASPHRGAVECDLNLLVIRPASVYLNLEDLKCFEVVEQQFHHYGITFKNAIALQPSNPAYPPRSGTTVLMAAPERGSLEISFSPSVTLFCGYVTSSQQTMISAYDPQDKLISRCSLASSNLAGSDSEIPPNAQVKIEQPDIARITFYAFDGQLTLSDLSIGF